MDKLKPFSFPHTLPAFNELESATSLEAIMMLHGVINKLIEEHNIQDAEIKAAIDSLTKNLEQTATNILTGLLEKGIIHENLEVVYDEQTEELTFKLLFTNTGGE